MRNLAFLAFLIWGGNIRANTDPGREKHVAWASDLDFGVCLNKWAPEGWPASWEKCSPPSVPTAGHTEGDPESSFFQLHALSVDSVTVYACDVSAKSASLRRRRFVPVSVSLHLLREWEPPVVWGGAGLWDSARAGFLEASRSSSQVAGWLCRLWHRAPWLPTMDSWQPSNRDLFWLPFLLIFGVSQVRRALPT